METVTPGTVLADRYRLTRPLGTGSSAVVWEAVDTSLGRMVAVKLLRGSAAAFPAGREQLRREAQALARLAHPRITTVFDYLEIPGSPTPDGRPGDSRPALVTELLNGELLADRLGAGPLPESDARRVCAQLAEALGAAHAAGIVHRDLKPGNVMLVADGVKLLDFGIAQTPADTDASTVYGALSPLGTPSTPSPSALAVGTPACMAPEQLTGQVATPASDVYALGCVLYWCLTGRPPFSATTLDEVVDGHLRATPPDLLVPGLPPQVAGLYRQCLAKDPAQRPTTGTVAAVLQQQAPAPRAHQTLVFSAYDTGYPEQPYDQPYPQPAPAGPPPRRSPRAALILGGVAIAALAAGATALLMSGGGDSNPTAGTPVSPATTPAAAPATTAAPPTTTTPTAPATVPNPTDPGSDPIAYLEQMRAQIQGYITDGAFTDPNAGQDLQNLIADLENSVTAARQGNFNAKKLRDTRAKIAAVIRQIHTDADHDKVDQDTADTLVSELQDLSQALAGRGGNG